MSLRRAVSLASIVAAFALLSVILYTATLIDRRPPSVERVGLSAPAGGERIAQPLSAIDIEFSEAVDHGSVERRFRIEPYVAGTISWDGSTAIFTPSARLPSPRGSRSPSTPASRTWPATSRRRASIPGPSRRSGSPRSSTRRPPTGRPGCRWTPRSWSASTG
jgi:hypothetical protein